MHCICMCTCQVCAGKRSLSCMQGKHCPTPCISIHDTIMQAKQAAAAKEKQAAKPNTPALAEDEGEQLDPNQYFEMRVKALNATKSSGKNPYPHKFAVHCSIPAFLSKWNGLASGEQRLDKADMESVAGVSAPQAVGTVCLLCHFR